MMVSNRNLLFQGFMFRFHVSVRGCIVSQHSIFQALWLLVLGRVTYKSMNKQTAFAFLRTHHGWSWWLLPGYHGTPWRAHINIQMFYVCIFQKKVWHDTLKFSPKFLLAYLHINRLSRDVRCIPPVFLPTLKSHVDSSSPVCAPRRGVFCPNKSPELVAIWWSIRLTNIECWGPRHRYPTLHEQTRRHGGLMLCPTIFKVLYISTGLDFYNHQHERISWWFMTLMKSLAYSEREGK